MPYLPKIILQDPADLVIANTTTRTALLEFDIPRPHLQRGHGIELLVVGYRYQNFVDLDSAFSTFGLDLNGVTFWEDTAGLYDDVDQRAPWRLSLEIRAKESNTAQEADGLLTLANRTESFPPAVGEGSVSTSPLLAVIHGEAAEDAEDDITFTFWVEMATADPDHVCARRYARAFST